VHVLADLKFPPIGELVVWKDIGGGINKVALIFFAAAIITGGLFWLAGRRAAMVPTGVQNVAESVLEFIDDGIIMQTIGSDGLGWAPFLTTLFCFILVCNIFEVVPFIQFPATARMALPAELALLVWGIFNFVGIKHQGLGGYFKSVCFPPGVPKALYLLVTPIEFLSTIIVRPFSLAVRLFANMLAGHLLLVTFAVLSAALFTKSIQVVILPLPAAMEIAITGFEILVAVLQAFIFTILTAVYIGGAMHPEH
jgi:F-type H+-transporting ATPase subunit a